MEGWQRELRSEIAEKSMKIYTKTGDSGTTGLFAGPRVSKDHPRIQAYGTIDELNALMGVVDALMSHESGEPFNPSDWIKEIQSDLFSIGAQLATPQAREHGMCLLTEARVDELEQWIDRVESHLPPLANFILPGGCRTSAMLHLARTVCRRAERDLVSLSHDESAENPGLLIVYLNRLSDLLFMLARWENQVAEIDDLPWTKPEVEE